MISWLRLPLSTMFLLVFLSAAIGWAREDRPQQPSCIRCHEGLEDQELSQPVKEWPQSVHARNGISCPDCHGGDMTLDDEEAMDPDKGFRGAPEEEDIPAFCGRCHPGVKEDYLDSAHGRALGAGGPQCVTCHGSHAIIMPSVALITPEKCSTCHSFERAATIRAALVETDSRIAALAEDLKKLHRLGIKVKALNAQLFNARNTFHRLFHTVDVEKVRRETEKIQSSLSDIRQKVTEIKERLARRKWAGAVVISLLLALAAIFFYLRRTYRQEE